MWKQCSEPSSWYDGFFVRTKVIIYGGYNKIAGILGTCMYSTPAVCTAFKGRRIMTYCVAHSHRSLSYETCLRFKLQPNFRFGSSGLTLYPNISPIDDDGGYGAGRHRQLAQTGRPAGYHNEPLMIDLGSPNVTAVIVTGTVPHLSLRSQTLLPYERFLGRIADQMKPVLPIASLKSVPVWPGPKHRAHVETLYHH